MTTTVSLIDCRFCCRPAGHPPPHCYMCLQRFEERSCLRKKTYLYRSDAERAAAVTDIGLEVYRCRYGPHWHVGHAIPRT